MNILERILCKFGLHNWSAWEQGEGIRTGLFIRVPERCNMQDRKCKTCGTSETEIL